MMTSVLATLVSSNAKMKKKNVEASSRPDRIPASPHAATWRNARLP